MGVRDSHVASAWNGQSRAEVGEARGQARRRLDDVGAATDGLPGDRGVGTAQDERGDPQIGKRRGRVGAGKQFLKIRSSIAVGIGIACEGGGGDGGAAEEAELPVIRQTIGVGVFVGDEVLVEVQSLPGGIVTVIGH